MSTEVTIAQLAELSAQHPETLLERLKQANVAVDSIDTPLTPKQKEAVLALLKPSKVRSKGKLALGSVKAETPAKTTPLGAKTPPPSHHSKVKVTVATPRISSLISGASKPDIAARTSSMSW